MKGKNKKVVVVGGGITGLTAAYTIQQMALREQLSIEVVLVESSLRIGGKIDTVRKNQCVIERGPESFFDSENYVRELARNLNIEHQMIQHQDGQTYISVGTHLHKIPSSFLLGGSSELTGLMTSSLISLTGKFRAAGDLFISRSSTAEDEPIGDFFRRRFGKEVVENLVEPLLAGTFAGDIDHLSMEAMFPHFAELELMERSLIKGFLKNKQGFYNKDTTSKALFYETFENGLLTLIEAIEKALLPGTIQLGNKVERITQLENGLSKIDIQNSKSIEADAVILTTPFNITQKLLSDVPCVQKYMPMKAATIGTVTLLYKAEHINKYKEAINIFVSRNSHFTITSCTFLNRKWANFCKEGYELLRVYIGRVGDESIVELSDLEIINIVQSDLEKMIGLTAKPENAMVARWQQGMPQYTVGHLSRVNNLTEDLAEYAPTLYLAGSSYNGLSIPSCVKQGRNVATECFNFIKFTAPFTSL